MALKPMNCPAHVQIFRQGIKSYRDLPIRLAEFGSCHRNEPHGALHGIMRVRQFTQDDAHIFCREDQIVEEIAAVLRPARRVYRDLGFPDYAIKLALRPEKRFGSDEMWDKAENDLREAVRSPPGRPEYGWETAGRGRLLCAQARIPPDRRDRPHLAVRHAPARLCPARAARRGLCRRGRREARPVMLHRAILGTFERFIGILIEHHAGRSRSGSRRCRRWWRRSSRRPTIMRARWREAARRRASGRDRPPEREDQLQGARAQPRESPLPARRRQARGGGRDGRAAPARRRRAAGSAGARRGGATLRAEALPPDLGERGRRG